MSGRPLQVHAAGLTDVGRARHHNEDSILVRQDLGLFVVSDGMGGHNAGEVASALTVASLRNFFEATSPGGASPNQGPDGNRIEGAERLSASVHKANRDVHEIATTHTRHRGMGCTLVVLHFQPPQAFLTHLGDSRVYRLRQRQLEQLTRDHTLVNDILALKTDITEADLAHLPKNVVTRAVGIEPAVSFDLRSETLEPGDVYLLCSDGLTGMLSDAEITEVLLMSPEPAEAASVLIHMANEAGGLDNISAVVVRVSDSGTLAVTERPPPQNSDDPTQPHIELSEVPATDTGDSPAPADVSSTSAPGSDESRSASSTASEPATTSPVTDAGSRASTPPPAPGPSADAPVATTPEGESTSATTESKTDDKA